MRLVKLSKAQFETLLEAERGGAIGLHCVPHYKPAQKLADLGLAIWRSDDRIAVTAAGITYLSKALAGATP